MTGDSAEPSAGDRRVPVRVAPDVNPVPYTPARRPVFLTHRLAEGVYA